METVFMAILFLILGIGMMAWSISRSSQLLERWASENNYKILESKICWFNKGPFFWTTFRGQMVYRVVVRTPNAKIQHGWVRCGGRWLGLLQDDVEEEWEN